MISMVLGASLAVFCLLRYFYLGINFKNVRKEISGYNLNYLSPDKEIKFLMYFLISKATPFINGLIIFAINLGSEAYSQAAVTTFTVVLLLITLSTELIFSYYLLPRVYYKYKGAGRRVKTINFNEM